MYPCVSIWPQALFCEQALQSQAPSSSSFQLAVWWEWLCVSLPSSPFSRGITGAGKPDAVGLSVLPEHTHWKWPVPRVTQALPDRPNSLIPTPCPAGWYPGEPLAPFFKWFSVLSETLLWLRLLLSFRLNKIFSFHLFCEMSSGLWHVCSPAPRRVRVLQLTF